MTSEVNLQGLRILIVDDLVEARSAIKSMLSMLGADNMDTATDGREAMGLIIEYDYDMVFADYNLGKGKDGQQILEEARYTNRLRATSSFVMVTGENAVDRVMGALEYDPDAYVTKPFTLSILRERLNRLWILKRILRPVNQAIDLNDIDWAIELAKQILEDNPRLLLPVSRILGKLYMRMERYEEAMHAYEQVLDSRGASWARLGQAVCHYKMGDKDLAVKMIRETLIDHPMYVQCHDWLAKILMADGEMEEAQKELQLAVSISPRAVLRQMELGKLALENDDVEVARNAFEQAMRLGRYSCYKSSDTYMQFVKVAQLGLDDSPDRDNRTLCNKALRALDEMKQEYSGQLNVIFNANIAESTTYKLTANEERARTSVEKAEDVLAKIKDPSGEQQLILTEAFVDTGQKEKAKNMMEVLRDRGLESDLLARLDSLESKLSNMSMREYSAALNEEGVGYYEKGDLAAAIKAFDKATRYEEAGVSVLLNTIQAKVSLMEREDIDILQLKDCYKLLRRIGSVGRLDERYERFTRLKTTCERLRRSAGV